MQSPKLRMGNDALIYFAVSCTTRIKKPYKDLAGSVASTREFIAKYTVGKVNAGNIHRQVHSGQSQCR